MKSILLTSLFTCVLMFSAMARTYELKNSSIRSIPLIIPSVMNPNLNPFSKSTAEFESGQRIYFLYKGKEYLLLEISDETPITLEVNKLVKNRKREIRSGLGN
ncbi:hypothetical protein [Marinoscillum sp.]|uniref:hypothetical protein n=1 Tax=Marinoscillum sp. TaxID=2024838 RepID=UPI003BA8B982